ncbi:hypothetical protein [Streptomyces sp. t39]|uniref:hypothetical protein n=1 Tax=Streptomyces sp. t39 TaxID=1828156 RepID=UPI0011CD9AEC|nr:hypothetical protein [Streptomyces sp. t39]TXS51359.1 hypothetical protein EAO77_26140 [Streptomyces sp. t39]
MSRHGETGRAAALLLLDGGGAPRVLPRDDPACWTAFDEEVRHQLRRGPRDRVSRAAARPETALCHPDGRIREAALARGPRGDAFWYLVVIRCTDWAEPVRLRARALLEEHLRAEPENALRTLTPLVLRTGRRAEGAWALDLFRAAYEARPALAAARLDDTRDTATRRLAARVVAARGRPGARESARRAASEHDPVLCRMWSDAALAAMAAEGADDGAVDTLLAARAPMVRAAGVTALRRAGRTREAAGSLTDRSALVRACARWASAQGDGDAHAHYRALSADPASLVPGAVAGLAECGRREDAALLRLLLTHASGAVRARAVAGLRSLECAPPALVLPLIDDPSPAVVREATEALLPYTAALPGEALSRRLAPGRPTPTRRAAFRLLRARGGLDQLRAAVALTADEDPGLRGSAESAVQLRRWVHDVPPGDAEVGELLDRCTHLFSEWVLTATRRRVGLPG